MLSYPITAQPGSDGIMKINIAPSDMKKNIFLNLSTVILTLQLLITSTTSFVNIAYSPEQGLFAIANMSGAPFPNTNWSAANVIDGNTDQTASGLSCAILDFTKGYTSVWLKVQLGRPFNIAYIELYLRNELTLYRSSGYFIYAFYDDTFDPASPSPNDLVYHHDPMSGCPAPIQNITVNRPARQIVFTNERPAGFNSTCLGYNSNLYTSIEICEIKVMGCDQNRYYSECTHVCPYRCKHHSCDAFNGSCRDGCANPNALTNYCLACSDGQYILNRQCVTCKGHCKHNSSCNKETGICDSGCDIQWTGHFCDKCTDFFYGADCSNPCGPCRIGDLCHNMTGYCPNGCQNHWTGNRCDVCSDYYFGSDCNTSCGHCINNDLCDKVTGQCPNGCQNHWMGHKCDGCIPYKYGPNCAFDCGHCKDGMSCSTDTGQCTKGCEDGWTGNLCVTVKMAAAESQTHNYGMSTSSKIAIAIPSSLLVISIIINILMGRYIMIRKNSRRHTDIPMSQKQERSQTYTDLTVTEETHAYTTLGSTVQEAPYQVISEPNNKRV